MATREAALIPVLVVIGPLVVCLAIVAVMWWRAPQGEEFPGHGFYQDFWEDD